MDRIVKEGLKRLNNTKNLGLKSLIKANNLQDKILNEYVRNKELASANIEDKTINNLLYIFLFIFNPLILLLHHLPYQTIPILLNFLIL